MILETREFNFAPGDTIHGTWSLLISPIQMTVGAECRIDHYDNEQYDLNLQVTFEVNDKQPHRHYHLRIEPVHISTLPGFKYGTTFTNPITGDATSIYYREINETQNG